MGAILFVWIQVSHTHSAYTSFLRKWYASGDIWIQIRWNQKLHPLSHIRPSSLSPWTSLWQTPHGWIGGAFGFCGLKIIGWLGGYILPPLGGCGPPIWPGGPIIGWPPWWPCGGPPIIPGGIGGPWPCGDIIRCGWFGGSISWGIIPKELKIS